MGRKLAFLLAAASFTMGGCSGQPSQSLDDPCEVARKNRRAGTTRWRISQPALSGEVEGYPSKVISSPRSPTSGFVFSAGTVWFARNLESEPRVGRMLTNVLSRAWASQCLP